MKERWKQVSDNAQDAQDKQLNVWLSGQGIPFENPEAEAMYQERAALVKDAIQLIRKPKRVPVCPAPGFFPIQYAGSTPYEAMYDYDALARIWEKYCVDFKPDTFGGAGNVVPGKALEILDFKLYRWPGHGVPKEQSYQFAEAAYMKPEEYPDLIDDPSGFFLRVYFPRIFAALKPFEKLPLFPLVQEIPAVPPGIAPFGTPDMQQALNSLMGAGAEAIRWAGKVQGLNRTIMAKGYPSFYGSFSKAPFDAIGDSLRGTTGIMMDMFRKADELIEACERMTPFMIKAGVAAAKASGHSLVFMPLHKGADGFMSEQQFLTFYWPTLKKVIIGLINEGMVPLLFAEGRYNTRLEIISELPKGSTIWWFDLTDMVRAKETVGKVACIAGNIPLPLLCTGTESDVKQYCRTLIDKVGRDGGFILSTGAGMDGCRVENARAMIGFSKEYGAQS
jgi:hypothetical protein